MKKDKIFSISVGITAYNEEKNIKSLILAILSQKIESSFIKEILVISDGSSDGTYNKISDIKDKRIKSFNEKKRQGQNSRFNQLLLSMSGDILIFFDADTIPVNNHYISLLVEPLIEKKNISVVYGASRPYISQNIGLFEQIISTVDFTKERMLKSLDNGDSLWLCGTGKAFLKKAMERFYWPKDVPEDTYIYLYCKKNNIKVSFQPKAILYYRSPGNFIDYLKKTTKYKKGKDMQKKYFNADFLNKQYYLPKKWILDFYLKLLSKPTFLFMYLIILILSRIFHLFAPEFNPLWDISYSTKNLERLTNKYEKNKYEKM